MAAVPQPPSAVRWLLNLSRELLNALRRTIADPALIEATRGALGLPPSAAGDSAGAAAKLDEIEAKLGEFDARPDEEFAFDEQVVEFLIGGRRFAQAVELMLPGKAADDARTYADLTYALATIFASEWLLRRRVPWAYAVVRFLMLGYERLEEVPRFDPLHIFDRLTGRATKTASDGFGTTEALGGLVIPPLVLVANALASKLHDEERLHGLAKGTPYLKGELDVTTGWEPADYPPQHAEVQALLSRALTIAFKGALKRVENETEFALDLLLTVLALAKEDGGPGFLLRGGGTGAFTLELPHAAGGTIKRALELKAAGGPGLEFLWNTEADTFKYIGTSTGNPSFELALESKGTEAFPAFRLGKANKSRLDLVGLKVGATAGPHVQSLFLEFSGGELVLKFDDLLPAGSVQDFFKSLGANKIGGRVDGRLKLDSHEGFVFDGEAALKVRLASNASVFGVARFDYLDLAIGAGKKGGIAIGLETAARFKLGTFTISVDRTGFAAVLNQDRGAIEISEQFSPPKGLGLKVDLVLGSGGGFLLLDHEKGEFAGAFELSVVGEFGIQAIAILNTKIPGNAAPFALFIMGFVRFPGGLELGLRFTLNALGALIGIHHGFDRRALEQALPSGAMDDVLFPADAVGDAPRIINSLRVIFPIQPNALTLGFMAELGWGSDYLCSIRLGIIVPLENVFGKTNEGSVFSRIVLLGRLAVQMFRDVPEAVRTQIIADFIGEISFDPFAISFFARLRDSRIAAIAVQGALVFSLRTGQNPRLIIAAGGFHPNFKEVPGDLPAPIDRLGSTYDIGLLKVWMRAYFAVTPSTLQFGAELGVRYKLGPLAFGGEIGLDALIRLNPFGFEATVYGSVAVTFRGHDLMGVSVRFTLWGPTRWRAKGRGEFSILFWDISIDFDESWGEQAKLPQDRVNLAALVRDDLKERGNWRLELPRGTPLMVQLADAPADDPDAPVHPLTTLSFVQKRVPFGLALQHYGSAAIEGPTQFPIPTVTDHEDNALGDAAVLTEHFAVAEYLELSDEDRLSKPSFQPMAAGVAIGTDDYRLPAGPPKVVALEYEEVFRDAPDRRTVPFAELDRSAALRYAARESAGRSAARFASKLADSSVAPVTTKTPDWLAADAAELKRESAASVPSWVAASAAAVGRTQSPAAARRSVVVEDFETVE